MPRESLSPEIDNENNSVMGYRTLFEWSDISLELGTTDFTRHVHQWLHHATL